MGEKLQRMRAAAAKGKNGQTEVKPSPLPEEKPSTPKGAMQDVTHACGHVVAYKGPQKAEHLPSWLAARVKKKCKVCNLAAEAERKAMPKKPKKPWRPSENSAEGRDWAMRQKGRLPDKSVFTAIYHADTQTWAGSLAVGDRLFTLEWSGVFKLLTKLDDQYRETCQ